MAQMRIPAVYMRGGTSKGVFFHKSDLPQEATARDAMLLRVIGSPDPYGKQIDGMGGASSSTSKVVLIGKSSRPGCDVDYLFGQVAIDAPLIDWSGNCGNLSAAVGPFAISEGLLQVAVDGEATVRIWQENLGKVIVAKVPVRNGEVQEEGDFELDGVTFPSAKIRLEFLNAGADEDEGGAGGLLPCGGAAQRLAYRGGEAEVTMINAGNPTVFVHAASLEFNGDELQEPFNSNSTFLARCEALRSRAAVAMGIARDDEEATRTRQHTPKLIFVAAARTYVSSRGHRVAREDIDLLARAVSMGKLHHAMTGTGAIAIAVAANIPGTVVHKVLARDPRGDAVRFGHPSGTLEVAATVREDGGRWAVDTVTMSRSARRLMEGWVRVHSASNSLETS